MFAPAAPAPDASASGGPLFGGPSREGGDIAGSLARGRGRAGVHAAARAPATDLAPHRDRPGRAVAAWRIASKERDAMPYI